MEKEDIWTFAYVSCSLKYVVEGFRKVDSDRWEFANDGFLRGQKHLLKAIKRRKPPPHSSSQQQSLGPFLELGHFGLEGEVEQLKRDKSILMAELVKLRQEQQNSLAHLRAIEDRILGTEQKQQQMMVFLARALRSPDFLQQLLQQKEKWKELEETISKKRSYPGSITDDDTVLPSRLKVEEGFEGTSRCEVPDLESLALEIQGFRRVREDEDDDEQRGGIEGRSRRVREEEEDDDDDDDEQKGETEADQLNDDFWEELLNEGIKVEDTLDVLVAQGNDVNLLAQTLGQLGCTKSMKKF